MTDMALDADNLPADATDEEAAAIAAAIAAYRDERAAAAAAAVAATGDADSNSTGRRSWEFTGRLSGLGIKTERAPSTTPTDDWRAASRADRF